MDEKKILRCVCYTRKSHEEGLEQSYNSLDAQRESVENYVASQKSNGWVLLPEHYDDGGFSGGNMERPALKQLLADVEAGKLDIIVVYKMDRLSRSLLDFMKLAEMLEQHNVSFVSVTQDINTSTSAGRMMLNILMTFCQYEMEICTERIKDKIAMSKRRGKHCGGPPLLGYDADSESKKLVVNSEEAKTVKLAFELYCQLGSSKQVAIELNKRGLRTKIWTSKKKRRIHPGRYFDQSMIQRMLSNHLYIGKVHHRGEFYQGEHKAIIEQKLWDDAQKIVAENRNSIGYAKKEMESPFKGLLKCGYCGGALGITYTQRHNRRYTYYICIKDEKRAISECPLSSIPTGETDRIILQQLNAIFKTPSMLAKVYAAALEDEASEEKKMRERKEKLLKEQNEMRKKILKSDNAGLFELKHQLNAVETEIAELEKTLSAIRECRISNRDITDAFESTDALWEELFPLERYRLARLLIERIEVTRKTLKMEIKTHGVTALVKELQSGNPENFRAKGQDAQTVSIEIPVTIKYKKGRKVIIAPDSEVPENQSPVQETLFQALTRAHSWLDLIESGEAATVTQLAEKLNLDKSYVGKIFRLINLAPDIQEMLIRGDEPDGLTLNQLRGTIPADWNEQRQIFGILPQQ